MSNGYLVAAEADLAAAHDIGDGFGLDVIDAGAIGDREAVAAALAGAANVGVLISAAAIRNDAFVALLRLAVPHLPQAHLILVDPEARAALGFIPDAWPAMTLEEARRRAGDAARRRDEAGGQSGGAPPESERSLSDGETSPPKLETRAEPPPFDDAPAPSEDAVRAAPEFGAPASKAPSAPPAAAAPQAPAPHPQQADFSRPRAEPPVARKTIEELRRTRAASQSPADATAFAPKKLRRGAPELVRIVVHQPKDLKDVLRAARQIDPRAVAGPQSMPIGEIDHGASIGVALDVRGASCDGALQRRTWTGDPLDFSFSLEADDVAQVVILARVFVDDAQIGVLGFTRGVMRPRETPASTGARARLKRHKRVFLSYSSQDRETVAAIATAYDRAGVDHFWDRTSLKSGEEWSPRLQREIEQCDLFHLCWSKAAAASEWVEKEAGYALERRQRTKKPDITVQMLDGPPWAPHPPHLDSIHFDDFVRAAIVGYARGDGA